MTNVNISYEPRMGNWQSIAGIRKWTPPEFDSKPGRLAFSPDCVPLSSHPAVLEREGAFEAVLERHLAGFTRFTEELELGLVTPFSLALRLGDVPFGVPTDLATEAGYIAADEIWHADSARLLRADDRAPVIRRLPPFLTLLRDGRKGLSQHASTLVIGLFTMVSETMITGTLTQVPRDERVRSDVRATNREHAREEAYHHGVYGQAIGIMWSQMSAGDRDLLGDFWGPAIKAFATPNVSLQVADLVSLGFDPLAATRIAAEAAEDALSTERLRQAAVGTMRFLTAHGILDHDPSRRGLERAGILK